MERTTSTRAHAGILPAVALVAATLAFALACGPFAGSAQTASSGTASEVTLKYSQTYYVCSGCDYETTVFRDNYGDFDGGMLEHEYKTKHKYTTDVREVTTQAKAQPVYRMYNSITSEHLYTVDKTEYQNLLAEHWTQEGEAWLSPDSGEKGVYRLYNPGLGALCKMSHHYTSDKSEADDLVKNHGWVYDNGGEPIFYSAEYNGGNSFYGSAGASHLMRLYNPGLSAHLWTLDDDEAGDLNENWGWGIETFVNGCGFWVYDPERVVNEE
jgi:hypothetical protein